MKAVDTNILARFILQDDEQQARLAAEVLRNPVWVSSTVLLELGWVLGRQRKLQRSFVAEALSTIIDLTTVNMPDRPGMIWAVERYRTGADWADAMHLIVCRDAADGFVTLDGNLATEVGPTSPIPVETLR